MKPLARTKAAKREAARRGRPYDGTVDREPNGRASRANKSKDADIIALSARAKHMGISLIQARDQRAATFIGVLAIRGEAKRGEGLSERQYLSALDYLALRGDYLRATNAPGAEYDPDGRSGGDFITARYEEWCAKIGTDYENCLKAIQAAQNEARADNLWAARDLVLIQGQRIEHLVGATRLLCNALAKFFKRD